MFSTLLDDSTDTLYDSGIKTIRKLPLDYPSVITTINSNKENYTNVSAGQFNFTNEVNSSIFSLQNNSGDMELIYDTNSISPTKFMNIGSDGLFTFTNLSKTNNTNDTTNLVPVVIDENGKISRGYILYKQIDDLSKRITILENTSPTSTTSPTIQERLTNVETLSSKIKSRIDSMKLGTPI